MQPMRSTDGGRPSAAWTGRRREAPRLLVSGLALAVLVAGCGLSPAPVANSSSSPLAAASSGRTGTCAQPAVTANWDGQSETLTGCAVAFGQVQVQPAVLRAGDHIQIVTHVGNLSLPAFQSTDGTVLAQVPVSNPPPTGQPGAVAEFVAREPGWANLQATSQTCKSAHPSACPAPQVVIGVEVLPAPPAGG